MGYLNNSTITVDAILTKKGRELLARGKDEFKITTSAVNELFFVNMSNLGLSKISLPNFLLSKKQRIQKKIFFSWVFPFFILILNNNEKCALKIPASEVVQFSKDLYGFFLFFYVFL